MFDNKALKKLIIPLIIEQSLIVLMGLIDIVMVNGLGEEAVSGVSNIDSLNVLITGIFTALANGGAIVSAQYIGRDDRKSASEAAKQLIYSVTAISIIVSVLCITLNPLIINAIYGNDLVDIYNYSVEYFYPIGISFPFVALYSATTALFRAMGNSRITLFSSLLMNIINIIANSLFIYGFKWGVFGAGFATMLSRIIVSVVLFKMLYNPSNIVNIKGFFKIRLNFSMIKTILKVGVPSGFENSLFQIGKVILQGLVNTLGTSSIAANAVAGQICNFALIPGSAMGMALITVVGQTMGAGEKQQARNNTKRLMKATYLIMGATCLIIGILAPLIVKAFNLQPETARLAQQIIIYHSIAASIIWPMSFTMPNAFRAAGDVKYTMFVAIGSMWLFRIGLAYLFVLVFNVGVIGVWFAMFGDWIFRSTLFLIHFIKGRWLNINLIKS